MGSNRPHLLTRLRRAVAKARFLLSFNLRQWLLSSTSHRRLSLDNTGLPPGLLDVADDYNYDNSIDRSSLPPPARCLSTDTPQPLLRTISRVVSGLSTGSSDDINQRAEDFIEKFYRQLRMERQISLELRYCNGKDVVSAGPSP